MKKFSTILMLAIILLAVAIRFYRIDRYPVHISAFEGIAGHAAILIAEGDAEAIKMALTRAKQPLYGSTGIAWNPFLVFPMALVYRLIGFDFSHFGIRLVPILYGVASVWLIYLLISGMFGKTTGLISAFLLATMSWFITLSRACNDFSATIFYSILCLLVYSRARRNILMHILLGALLGLGSYFYLPARMVALIVFVAVFFRCVFERGYFKGAWLGLILMAAAFQGVCYLQGMNAVSYYGNALRDRGHESAWRTPNIVQNVKNSTHRAYNHFFVHWGWRGTSELAYERDGSGLDPISRWLVAIGLFLSLLKKREHKYRFLLIWFIGAAMIVAFAYMRDKRGLLLVPVFASLAAVAISDIAGMVVKWAEYFNSEILKMVSKSVITIVILVLLFEIAKANLDNWFGEYARREASLLGRRTQWISCVEKIKVLKEKDLYTDCFLGERYHTGKYLARLMGKGYTLYQLPSLEAKRKFDEAEGPAVLFLKSGESKEK